MQSSEMPNILLVMDEDTDESHAVHILAKYHFANQLVKLRRGRDALRFFAQVNATADPPKPERPELIILSLEEGQLIEVAMASRKDRLSDVPLILVAASKEEEDSLRKLNLPRTYCLGKPLGFFKLLEAMQKLGMFWVVLKSPPS